MGIKQSIWQYLDYDFLKLKYWQIDTREQFPFGVRSGSLCYLFCNPEKYSWTHWPSHDWTAKLLIINLICPHQNRPNYWVHTLVRFLSGCGVTHMGYFCLIPFFSKSILPRSFSFQLGAASALLEHQQWHNHSQQQLQPQSRNALAVSHGKAALPAELCGWKTF